MVVINDIYYESPNFADAIKTALDMAGVGDGDINVAMSFTTREYKS